VLSPANGEDCPDVPVTIGPSAPITAIAAPVLGRSFFEREA
jgi:hypothetical protein